MRLQNRLKSALVRGVAALFAGVFALPASGEELQWIQHRSPSEPSSVAQAPANDPVGVHESAVQRVAFTEPTIAEHPAPRRVAKQPTKRKTSNRVTKRVAKQPSPRPVAKPVQQAVVAAAPAEPSGEVVFASTLAAEQAASEEIELVCHDGACHCGGCMPSEPGCAVIEPGCEFVEPGCEFVEPGCGCGDVGCGGCVGPAPPATRICICLPPINAFTVFAGVQGFKSPLDAYRDRGNFGFNQGFNLGGKIPWFHNQGFGYQVGYRVTQNQLNGSQFNSGTGSPATAVGGEADSHTQSFATIGLFRRCDSGLQYGLVYDHLHDERLETVDFNQVRGEISIANPKGGEIGFMFSSGTNEEMLTVTPPGVTATVEQLFAASDQYLAFYRFRACSGGEFRVFAGGDSDSRGILGADMLAPLNHSWSINTGFRYIIAEEAALGVGSTQEAWNIGIDLIYHFHRSGKRWHNSRFRPLFNVADNGSLSVDQID